MEWEYSVGHPVLDKEHEDIFTMLSQLKDLAAAPASEAALNEMLRELINHFTSHFAREELVMRQYGYPDIEDHARVHANLAELVLNELADLGNIQQSLERIADIVKDHIITHDFQYGEFIRGKVE